MQLKAPMKWEYKTIKQPAGGFTGGKFDGQEWDQKLNDLGQQGWELVTVFGTHRCHGQTRDVVAMFKRQR